MRLLAHFHPLITNETASRLGELQEARRKARKLHRIHGHTYIVWFTEDRVGAAPIGVPGVAASMPPSFDVWFSTEHDTGGS